MIDGSDPGGSIVGAVDARVTTMADDAYWDETGFTASIGADADAAAAGPAVPPHRPSWVPVGE